MELSHRTMFHKSIENGRNKIKQKIGNNKPILLANYQHVGHITNLERSLSQQQESTRDDDGIRSHLQYQSHKALHLGTNTEPTRNEHIHIHCHKTQMFHEYPAKGRHWSLLHSFRSRKTKCPIVHVHHQNHHHSDESQQFHIRLTFHRLSCFRMNQHHLIFGMQKYRTISNYQNFETSNIVLNPHCNSVDCFSKIICHVSKRVPSAFPKKVIY